MKLIDGRIQVVIGILMVAASLYIQTKFTIQMGPELIVWSGLLQGGGTGFSMIVINYVAIACTPAHLRTEGAAVYTLIRNIATSIMIATASAVLARNIQLNHLEVGSALKTGSTAFGMAQLAGGNFAAERIAAMANLEINRQAMMIAYLDDFWMMMWACLATIPLVLLIKPKRGMSEEPVAVLE